MAGDEDGKHVFASVERERFYPSPTDTDMGTEMGWAQNAQNPRSNKGRALSFSECVVCPALNLFFFFS